MAQSALPFSPAFLSALADCTQIKGLRWQYVTVVDTHTVAKPSFHGFDEVKSDRELGKLMTSANLEPM